MRRFAREFCEATGYSGGFRWCDGIENPEPYVRWLERELDRARRAALALLAACEAADEAGELDQRIDGDLLDACKALDPARKAKGGRR